MVADTKKQADTKLLLGLSGQVASGIGAIASSYIDYKMVKVQEQFAKNRASEIELQAQERSNILLEQFNSAIGNIQYSAARRGVKAGEGSVERNIEMSGKAIGTDMAKAKQSAKLKASAVRAQGSINRLTGETLALGGALEGAKNIFEGGKGIYDYNKTRGKQ